jgi:hypothetical protein
MKPSGSTLIDHPGRDRAGLGRMTGGALAGRTSREEIVTLLLPMVRRAVRTGRGPAALITWLRRSPSALRTGPVAVLVEDLARQLAAPVGAADTLDDP